MARPSVSGSRQLQSRRRRRSGSPWRLCQRIRACSYLPCGSIRLYGPRRGSDDEAEQAYKHGFCRGRSSLSSGGHPPPLAAYPGTARATPWSPYAALLQVALARFTPLARVRHCGAGLASRRRGVTPYLALWSPDFPRRLAPTRPSSLLGRLILGLLIALRARFRYLFIGRVSWFTSRLARTISLLTELPVSSP